MVPTASRIFWLIEIRVGTIVTVATRSIQSVMSTVPRSTGPFSAITGPYRDADFGLHSFKFAPSAFLLPDGVTANAGDYIVDNRFVDPLAVPTDVPAPGDFDGDGKDDLTVFRPASGTWYVRLSSTSSMLAVPFGMSGDVPVTAPVN